MNCGGNKHGDIHECSVAAAARLLIGVGDGVVVVVVEGVALPPTTTLQALQLSSLLMTYPHHAIPRRKRSILQPQCNCHSNPLYLMDEKNFLVHKILTVMSLGERKGSGTSVRKLLSGSVLASNFIPIGAFKFIDV